MSVDDLEAEYDRTRMTFRTVRELVGLSQLQAASAMGVSVGTIQNFEGRKVTPHTETIARFQDQVRKWEAKVGRAKLESKARERGTVYVPTVLLLRADYECPHCHELTPGPSEAGGKQALWCVWCGKGLGIVCPVCKTIETRLDKKFCGECGSKLRPEG
ncbi:MAG: hypothetical protein IT366_24465 [Candidatus Hydrogenedentes bacterium]|nr:hypothetical protein [Candidatus Hydrogenedentota bacterium]